MSNKNLEKIREVVRTECNEEGCTIGELAQRAGVSRNTARAYSERLIGEGYVKVREVGPAKLLKYNPHSERER
ncbi:MAG: winged helix-turn-helix transcriptional regulator [Candidatus Altiarchaeota archaeon]